MASKPRSSMEDAKITWTEQSLQSSFMKSPMAELSGPSRVLPDQVEHHLLCWYNGVCHFKDARLMPSISSPAPGWTRSRSCLVMVGGHGFWLPNANRFKQNTVVTGFFHAKPRWILLCPGPHPTQHCTCNLDGRINMNLCWVLPSWFISHMLPWLNWELGSIANTAVLCPLFKRYFPKCSINALTSPWIAPVMVIL